MSSMRSHRTQNPSPSTHTKNQKLKKRANTSSRRFQHDVSRNYLHGIAMRASLSHRWTYLHHRRNMTNSLAKATPHDITEGSPVSPDSPIPKETHNANILLSLPPQLQRLSCDNTTPSVQLVASPLVVPFPPEASRVVQVLEAVMHSKCPPGTEIRIAGGWVRDLLRTHSSYFCDNTASLSHHLLAHPSLRHRVKYPQQTHHTHNNQSSDLQQFVQDMSFPSTIPSIVHTLHQSVFDSQRHILDSASNHANFSPGELASLPNDSDASQSEHRTRHDQTLNFSAHPNSGHLILSPTFLESHQFLGDIDIAVNNMTGAQLGEYLLEYCNENGVPCRIQAVSSDCLVSRHLATARGVIYDDISIDLVNLRTETYVNTNAHRVPLTEFGSPSEDACRRDFTVNALFFNINTKMIEDYNGGAGIVDLREGRMCTPLNPFDIFHDDPLRILRVVRFASRFGFIPSFSLFNAAHQKESLNGLLFKVSRERIGKEVHGAFQNKSILSMVNGRLIFVAQLLASLHALPSVFPLFFVETARKVSLRRQTGMTIRSVRKEQGQLQKITERLSIQQGDDISHAIDESVLQSAEQTSKWTPAMTQLLLRFCTSFEYSIASLQQMLQSFESNNHLDASPSIALSPKEIFQGRSQVLFAHSVDLPRILQRRVEVYTHQYTILSRRIDSLQNIIDQYSPSVLAIHQQQKQKKQKKKSSQDGSGTVNADTLPENEQNSGDDISSPQNVTTATTTTATTTDNSNDEDQFPMRSSTHKHAASTQVASDATSQAIIMQKLYGTSIKHISGMRKALQKIQDKLQLLQVQNDAIAALQQVSSNDQPKISNQTHSSLALPSRAQAQNVSLLQLMTSVGPIQRDVLFYVSPLLSLHPNVFLFPFSNSQPVIPPSYNLSQRMRAIMSPDHVANDENESLPYRYKRQQLPYLFAFEDEHLFNNSALEHAHLEGSAYYPIASSSSEPAFPQHPNQVQSIHDQYLLSGGFSAHDSHHFINKITNTTSQPHPLFTNADKSQQISQFDPVVSVFVIPTQQHALHRSFNYNSLLNASVAVHWSPHRKQPQASLALRHTLPTPSTSSSSPSLITHQPTTAPATAAQPGQPPAHFTPRPATVPFLWIDARHELIRPIFRQGLHIDVTAHVQKFLHTYLKQIGQYDVLQQRRVTRQQQHKQDYPTVFVYFKHSQVVHPAVHHIHETSSVPPIHPLQTQSQHFTDESSASSSSNESKDQFSSLSEISLASTSTNMHDDLQLHLLRPFLNKDRSTQLETLASNRLQSRFHLWWKSGRIGPPQFSWGESLSQPLTTGVVVDQYHAMRHHPSQEKPHNDKTKTQPPSPTTTTTSAQCSCAMCSIQYNSWHNLPDAKDDESEKPPLIFSPTGLLSETSSTSAQHQHNPLHAGLDLPLSQPSLQSSPSTSSSSSEESTAQESTVHPLTSTCQTLQDVNKHLDFTILTESGHIIYDSQQSHNRVHPDHATFLAEHPEAEFTLSGSTIPITVSQLASVAGHFVYHSHRFHHTKLNDSALALWYFDRGYRRSTKPSTDQPPQQTQQQNASNSSDTSAAVSSPPKDSKSSKKKQGSSPEEKKMPQIPQSSQLWSLTRLGIKFNYELNLSKPALISSTHFAPSSQPTGTAAAANQISPKTHSSLPAVSTQREPPISLSNIFWMMQHHPHATPRALQSIFPQFLCLSSIGTNCTLHDDIRGLLYEGLRCDRATLDSVQVALRVSTSIAALSLNSFYLRQIWASEQHSPLINASLSSSSLSVASPSEIGSPEIVPIPLPHGLSDQYGNFIDPRTISQDDLSHGCLFNPDSPFDMAIQNIIQLRTALLPTSTTHKSAPSQQQQQHDNTVQSNRNKSTPLSLLTSISEHCRQHIRQSAPQSTDTNSDKLAIDVSTTVDTQITDDLSSSTHMQMPVSPMRSKRDLQQFIQDMLMAEQHVYDPQTDTICPKYDHIITPESLARAFPQMHEFFLDHMSHTDPKSETATSSPSPSKQSPSRNHHFDHISSHLPSSLAFPVSPSLLSVSSLLHSTYTSLSTCIVASNSLLTQWSQNASPATSLQRYFRNNIAQSIFSRHIPDENDNLYNQSTCLTTNDMLQSKSSTISTPHAATTPENKSNVTNSLEHSKQHRQTSHSTHMSANKNQTLRETTAVTSPPPKVNVAYNLLYDSLPRSLIQQLLHPTIYTEQDPEASLTDYILRSRRPGTFHQPFISASEFHSSSALSSSSSSSSSSQPQSQPQSDSSSAPIFPAQWDASVLPTRQDHTTMHETAVFSRYTSPLLLTLTNFGLLELATHNSDSNGQHIKEAIDEILLYDMRVMLESCSFQNKVFYPVADESVQTIDKLAANNSRSSNKSADSPTPSPNAEVPRRVSKNDLVALVRDHTGPSGDLELQRRWLQDWSNLCGGALDIATVFGAILPELSSQQIILIIRYLIISVQSSSLASVMLQQRDAALHRNTGDGSYH